MDVRREFFGRSFVGYRESVVNLGFFIIVVNVESNVLRILM